MAQTIPHDALAMIEYGEVPSILVLAGSPAATERARQTVETAGCRVCDTAPLIGGAERLDRQVAMDAAFVEVDGDPGTELDRLLDRLDAGARTGRFGSVVSAPPSLIDAVAARISHLQIHHLCEASELDRVAAVAIASSRRSALLHDVRREQGPVRLQQLSEEVGRIATILATLSVEDSRQPRPGSGPATAGTIDSGQVRAIIRARRLRDHYFDCGLFADPAWDMLLDLMAARLEQQRVAVSSLCIAAAVPATTALRWIKTLTDHGLFVRHADPQDGRRVYIDLSDDAAAGLEAYLKAAQRVSPLIV